jgi:hypothetical protein
MLFGITFAVVHRRASILVLPKKEQVAQTKKKHGRADIAEWSVSHVSTISGLLFFEVQVRMSQEPRVWVL